MVEDRINVDKWAIYLRKSRADAEAEKLGEGETLARHKMILTELAARKGLYVDRIYQEIVSGESIEARPMIQELIKDCYAGKYRGIIIIEVTRLSRGSSGDAQIIMDCLRYANHNEGLLVVTPTKLYDVAHSSDDEEYMEFELFMSRREYKMIKRRMDRGRTQAVVEGNYMGAYRPYGYDIVKTKTARTLEPNPEEAPIVRQIFDWAAHYSYSAGKIARTLTTMGVPTYRSDGEWNTGTIKTILTNPTYIGKVKWNDRMQIKTMKGGELVTSRPRSNHTEHYMEYDGKHKALIDEETFMAANSRFGSDKTKADLKLINPLAGLLRCKNCGKVMAYRDYSKRAKHPAEPRYVHPDSQKCKVKSVVVTDVLNAVARSLELYLSDFETKVDNLPDVDEDSLQAQLNTLNDELRKVERKLSKAFDDYEDGVYTANEFVERKAIHNARIDSIKRQIHSLEETIPEREQYTEVVMKLTDALTALPDPAIEAQEKNAFLKEIIDKIEFSRENRDEFIIDVDLKV